MFLAPHQFWLKFADCKYHRRKSCWREDISKTAMASAKIAASMSHLERGEYLPVDVAGAADAEHALPRKRGAYGS